MGDVGERGPLAEACNACAASSPRRACAAISPRHVACLAILDLLTRVAGGQAWVKRGVAGLNGVAVKRGEAFAVTRGVRVRVHANASAPMLS